MNYTTRARVTHAHTRVTRARLRAAHACGGARYALRLCAGAPARHTHACATHARPTHARPGATETRNRTLPACRVGPCNLEDTNPLAIPNAAPRTRRTRVTHALLQPKQTRSCKHALRAISRALPSEALLPPPLPRPSSGEVQPRAFNAEQTGVLEPSPEGRRRNFEPAAMSEFNREDPNAETKGGSSARARAKTSSPVRPTSRSDRESESQPAITALRDQSEVLAVLRSWTGRGHANHDRQVHGGRVPVASAPAVPTQATL